MTSADIIVVGSGPSGTFAAFQLRGRGVLVLDVGHRPDGDSALHGNLYDLRKEPAAAGGTLFGEVIGPNYEGLHNVFHPYLSPKLKAPRLRFVTAGARDSSSARWAVMCRHRSTCRC